MPRSPQPQLSKASLQICPVDALARLIEANLFTADQSFLQPCSDLNGLHRALELQWNRCIVQAGVCKFVRLFDKPWLEATPIVPRNLGFNQYASLSLKYGFSYLSRDSIGGVYID